jgi:hypothetical protein
VVLAALHLGGVLRLPHRRPLIVALAAIWGFAAWTLLSATWADSPAGAWEGAGRTLLYAGLVTVALTAVRERRERRWVGAALAVGVAIIALITLVRLVADGTEAFLAGRLDDPIGYRNGTAALFGFAVWPLIGVAAVRGFNPALRAAAFGGAVLLLGLAFLTQSRGVLLGVAAGAVISLAVGPDRLRRAWIAVGAGAAVAAASGALLMPYHAFDGGDGTVTGADVGRAADALLLTVVLALVVGLFLALLDNGLRSSPQAALTGRRVATGGLGLILATGLVAGLVAIGNPVAYADEKIEEFKDLEPTTPSGSTRLGTVSGQRYDLWRVAWEEFRDEPLGGVGEGSYAFGYYRERKTDRNLGDPHSLPFRLLAETGLVGTLLFGTFTAGLGVAIARRAREATPEDRRSIAALAAAGGTVLAQSLIDWLWLLPGVTGLGLFALALAAGDEGEAGVDPATRGAPPTWARVTAGAALLAAVASVTLLFLSDLYVRKAREQAASENPGAQLDAARTAERLNPPSLTPLYLQASALETEGQVDEARAALAEALDREPANFVTLGLLGDLEIRARNEAEAREYYRRAVELNPRDTGLQRLAQR